MHYRKKMKNLYIYYTAQFTGQEKLQKKFKIKCNIRAIYTRKNKTRLK